MIRGEVGQATAAVGQVLIKLHDEFQTLTFEKQADGVWIERALDSGPPARVKIDHQIVTVDDQESDTLKAAAYGMIGLHHLRAMDHTGRMLRFNRYESAPEGTRYVFWGQVDKVELVVVDEVVEREIPFELVWGDPDAEAFTNYKQRVIARMNAPIVPKDWPWDIDEFNPDKIPNQPVQGTLAGARFVAEHVTIIKRQGSESTGWDIEFCAAKPDYVSKGYDEWLMRQLQLMGRRADDYTEEQMNGFRRLYYSQRDVSRSISFRIPDGHAGLKLIVPAGSSEWDSHRALSFYYFRRWDERFDGPDSESSSWTNIAVGSRVWLNFELTRWDETPSPHDEHIIGKAAGRIAVGSLRGNGETCRVCGNFTADMIVP